MRNNSKTLRSVVLAIAAVTTSVAALADTYRVSVTGTVSSNFMGGAMAGMGSGTPASMSFLVDSTISLDGTSGATRGFLIDPTSFQMTVGGAVLVFDQTQAASYFGLRNNNPGVDGVFISHNGNGSQALSINVPGVTLVQQLTYSRTFAGGNPDTTLSSLNLADAVGNYAPGNVSGYTWTLGRNGGTTTELIPTTLTISAVPEPASALMLGLGALALGLRRRKSA